VQESQEESEGRTTCIPEVRAAHKLRVGKEINAFVKMYGEFLEKVTFKPIFNDMESCAKALLHLESSDEGLDEEAKKSMETVRGYLKYLKLLTDHGAKKAFGN
jgi:hypothetical protein